MGIGKRPGGRSEIGRVSSVAGRGAGDASLPDVRAARSPFGAIYAAIAGLTLALLAGLLLLPLELAAVYASEDGPVETLSAFGWFAAALVLLAVARSTGWGHGGLAAAFVFLAGLRELDFQKRFTETNVVKIKYLLSSGAPFAEKAAVLAILLAIALCAAWFLKRNLPLVLGQIRRRHPPALALAALFAVGAFTKVLDRLPNTLKEWGVVLLSDSVAVFGIVEEAVELSLPCLLIAIVFHYRQARDRASAGAGTRARPPAREPAVDRAESALAVVQAAGTAADAGRVAASGERKAPTIPA